MTRWHVSSLDALSDAERKQVIQRLTADEAAALLYYWPFWAREKQLPPAGDWSTWLILAGRGFGKTRTGAEMVRKWVTEEGAQRVALVARTAADARDVMVEGESGLLSVFPPDERPIYEPSKRRLTFATGAIATTYSGDIPEQLRGPQHDYAWADELAAWRYPDAWDQLQYGLRLGNHPRAVVTTTPRPTRIIRELLDDPSTAVTTGTTYENAANLPTSVLSKFRARYEGTRLGRQELLAEVLLDMPGALWTRDIIEDGRVSKAPDMTRVVVGVDPAVTANEDSSNQTGIVVVGIDEAGHGYVLDDISLVASPREWAYQAVSAYHKWRADRIVAETNQGGDMVLSTIRTVDTSVPVKQVRASRGKYTRAEPISALYEQGKIHHVGAFAELEDQMCMWVPGEKSPDRLDAMVWGFTELTAGASRELETRDNPFTRRR